MHHVRILRAFCSLPCRDDVAVHGHVVQKQGAQALTLDLCGFGLQQPVCGFQELSGTLFLPNLY
jgi:hypothetical protein